MNQLIEAILHDKFGVKKTNKQGRGSNTFVNLSQSPYKDRATRQQISKFTSK